MKIDLTKFGSDEFPLRASSLPMLMQCPWRAVLLFAREYEDEVGTAAHTGSATHKAIEAWHSHFDYFDALQTAKSFEREYPKVDWSEVELYFRPYTLDPRNRNATIFAIEKSFKIAIKETQNREINIELNGDKEVVITGTSDQLRLDNGQRMVYDIKTGKTYGGKTTLDVYTVQLATYWIGAVASGFQVDGIGVILPNGYRAKTALGLEPDGVFFRSPLTYPDCSAILKGVYRRVMEIRAGNVSVVPGPHCQFCPAGSPSVCVPILRSKM